MKELEIKAPLFPESISEGALVAWHYHPGDWVKRDEPLAEIETEKVVLEIVAPEDGKLKSVNKAEGDIILSEEILAHFIVQPADETAHAESATAKKSQASQVASPAARKLASEKNVDISALVGTGKSGLVTKDDVAKAAEDDVAKATEGNVAKASPAPKAAALKAPIAPAVAGQRLESRVPMTRLRATIARRLVEAQNSAAMLTTFNEVNMSAVMALRARCKDEFAEVHNGTRLGFMSFFVCAAVEALRKFPSVNASLDGSDIVYHGYYDISVAVSTDRGLVTPVVRNADLMTLAEIENCVRQYGEKAQAGKLAIEDMQGGTFTISNGGVYGSLLSTPILNPPQTAILGMHAIQDRPVAIDGEICIQPMMYLALSYDHRLIDGAEAVRFLVAIKRAVEDPARILLAL